jgi:hypothetical protein
MTAKVHLTVWIGVSFKIRINVIFTLNTRLLINYKNVALRFDRNHHNREWRTHWCTRSGIDFMILIHSRYSLYSWLRIHSRHRRIRYNCCNGWCSWCGKKAANAAVNNLQHCHRTHHLRRRHSNLSEARHETCNRLTKNTNREILGTRCTFWYYYWLNEFYLNVCFRFLHLRRSKAVAATGWSQFRKPVRYRSHLYLTFGILKYTQVKRVGLWTNPAGCVPNEAEQCRIHKEPFVVFLSVWQSL